MPSLFEIINQAFAETVYPGDDNLTVYHYAGQENDETWKLLRGKDWRSMPIYDYITGDTPIPDLTPQAFHYYLPALLMASLTEEQAEWVLDPLVFFLNPKNSVSDHPKYGYDSRKEFEQFMSFLTHAQLGAVHAVIAEWKACGWLEDEDYLELTKAYEIE